MRAFGLKIREGGSIENLTAPFGPSFPPNENDAELFFLTSGNVGLYVYMSGEWRRIATETEVQDRHASVLLDGSSSSVSHTIPEASTLDGFRYTMKRVDDSQFFVTASLASGDPIDGDVVLDLYGYESITLLSSGGNWYVI